MHRDVGTPCTWKHQANKEKSAKQLEHPSKSRLITWNIGLCKNIVHHQKIGIAKAPEPDSRPIIMITLAMLRASALRCFPDPCFLTWTSYSSEPIASAPSFWPCWCHATRDAGDCLQGFVPTSPRFQTVGTWTREIAPSTTACWIHSTCFSFLGPNLIAICRADEESTKRKWSISESTRNSMHLRR